MGLPDSPYKHRRACFSCYILKYNVEKKINAENFVCWSFRTTTADDREKKTAAVLD